MNASARRVLITGVAGRVGRAIRAALLRRGDIVIGLDRITGAGVDIHAGLDDTRTLRDAVIGVDALVHTAALHAPHVGSESDADFVSINVDGTRRLLDCAAAAGVARIVFTSTTALYGDACVAPDRAVWVDETLPPSPRTIYHRTKLAAERLLREAAGQGGPSVRILRMSRCFPEPADAMAVLRLHRGVDARDAAAAHAAAIDHAGAALQTYVISAATPFRREDAVELVGDAPAVIGRRRPDLVTAFAARGWRLPRSIDRVYCADAAIAALGWTPRYGFDEILRMHDAGDPEVLAPSDAYVVDGDLRG
ncbi:MAG: NAD(P)-dependent oxidoreductase [Lysobacteraceae bacterium]|nr:MAG: NAD(P)-dependent oxidoreductase [Xanthomonadaceae bacterium]